MDAVPVFQARGPPTLEGLEQEAEGLHLQAVVVVAAAAAAAEGHTCH